MQMYRWGAKEMLYAEPERADRAAETEVERAARVMALRKAIRNGTYKVQALAVADRMMENLIWP